MKEQTASQPGPIARSRPKIRIIFEIGLICVTFALVLLILLPRKGSYEARTTAATTQIRTFGTALEAYKTDTGGYPPTILGLKALIQAPAGIKNWHGPYYVKEISMDPWGHNFIYICPGIHNPQSYDLSSRGPDGFVGNDDDIGNWQQE